MLERRIRQGKAWAMVIGGGAPPRALCLLKFQYFLKSLLRGIDCILIIFQIGYTQSFPVEGAVGEDDFKYKNKLHVI